MGWDAVGWAAVSGICGAAGLIAFYAGFAAAPISVVAPVAALVSTVLPVGIAIAGGERLTARMLAGGLICLVAIVGVSMPAARRSRQGHRDGPDAGAARLRGLAYGAAAGAGFGLFFLCLKNAGQSGVLWPVAISRTAGTLIAVGIVLATRTRPWRREGGGFVRVADMNGWVSPRLGRNLRTWRFSTARRISRNAGISKTSRTHSRYASRSIGNDG